MTFEDSNHKVTLSGNEISTILYIMEGYINPSDDYSYDPDFRKDVDNIFEKLEGVADSWEGEFAEPKVTQFDANDVEKCIADGNDYSDCVDRLVESMETNWYVAFTYVINDMRNRINVNYIFHIQSTSLSDTLRPLYHGVTNNYFIFIVL